MDKDSVITNLNQVYFENRIFLTDHQLTQSSLFEDFDKEEKIEGFSAKTSGYKCQISGDKSIFYKSPYPFGRGYSGIGKSDKGW